MGKEKENTVRTKVVTIQRGGRAILPLPLRRPQLVVEYNNNLTILSRSEDKEEVDSIKNKPNLLALLKFNFLLGLGHLTLRTLVVLPRVVEQSTNTALNLSTPTLLSPSLLLLLPFILHSTSHTAGHSLPFLLLVPL